MVHDLIRYDILVQDALRKVIQKVLFEVSKAGLPGEHHFFITFLTEAPGVKISQHLKERYADHMTIVLQHQFWDLEVTDTQFSVTLSFGDRPEKLVVPYSAIQVFYDPAAAFEAAFDLPPLPKEEGAAETTKLQPIKIAKEPQKEKKVQDKPAEKTSADVVSLDVFRKKK